MKDENNIAKIELNLVRDGNCQIKADLNIHSFEELIFLLYSFFDGMQLKSSAELTALDFAVAFYKDTFNDPELKPTVSQVTNLMN